MKTLNDTIKNPSGFDSLRNYIGETEFDGWYVVMTQNRDSDVLTRSNFRSALRKLGGEGESVAIHRFGHWACGWWEALCVKEGTEAFKVAEEIREDLEGYPVVDENDFSELETEEANSVWKSCYNTAERLEFMRSHPQQFEGCTLSSLKACARGEYFLGYAEEMLR